MIINAMLAIVSIYASNPCVERLLNQSLLLSFDREDQGPVSITYAYIGREKVGNIAVQVDDKTMKIHFIHVKKEYQKNGISKRLYERVVNQNPEVTEIESLLSVDNLKIAKEEGLENCIKAVSKTPAYKARFSMGFTRVTRCELSAFGIELKMSK